MRSCPKINSVWKAEVCQCPKVFTSENFFLYCSSRRVASILIPSAVVADKHSLHELIFNTVGNTWSMTPLHSTSCVIPLSDNATLHDTPLWSHCHGNIPSSFHRTIEYDRLLTPAGFFVSIYSSVETSFVCPKPFITQPVQQEILDRWGWDISDFRFTQAGLLWDDWSMLMKSHLALVAVRYSVEPDKWYRVKKQTTSNPGLLSFQFKEYGQRGCWRTAWFCVALLFIYLKILQRLQ